MKNVKIFFCGYFVKALKLGKWVGGGGGILTRFKGCLKQTQFFSDQVASDTVLMLTNAIYFKEAWTVAFKEVAGGNQVEINC